MDFVSGRGLFFLAQFTNLDVSGEGFMGWVLNHQGSGQHVVQEKVTSYTLPETKHLKMDGWNTPVLFWMLSFQVLC